jgi:hypothetical protein
MTHQKIQQIIDAPAMTLFRLWLKLGVGVACNVLALVFMFLAYRAAHRASYLEACYCALWVIIMTLWAREK